MANWKSGSKDKETKERIVSAIPLVVYYLIIVFLFGYRQWEIIYLDWL